MSFSYWTACVVGPAIIMWAAHRPCCSVPPRHQHVCRDAKVPKNLWVITTLIDYGAMNLIIISLHAQQDGAFRLCKVCSDASLLLLSSTDVLLSPDRLVTASNEWVWDPNAWAWILNIVSFSLVPWCVRAWDWPRMRDSHAQCVSHATETWHVFVCAFIEIETSWKKNINKNF